MEMRPIGSREVSAVGLGCNNFGRRLDEPDTSHVIHAALDAGVNFFDTADSYGGTDSDSLAAVWEIGASAIDCCYAATGI